MARRHRTRRQAALPAADLASDAVQLAGHEQVALLVELAQVVEDEFGVEITSQDMQSLLTVGHVIDLVVERAA